MTHEERHPDQYTCRCPRCGRTAYVWRGYATMVGADIRKWFRCLRGHVFLARMGWIGVPMKVPKKCKKCKGPIVRIGADPDDGLCFCCRKDVNFGIKPKKAKP